MPPAASQPDSVGVSGLGLLNSYAIVFVVAFIVTLLVTPLVRQIALRANVTDNVQLRATAAFLDASFDSVGTAVTVITVDSDLANAPESSYSLGGTFEAPLGNGAALSFNIDYTWRDDIQSARNFNNQLTLPDLGLLNASLNYYFPGDQLTISLAGTNLTDEYYFSFFRDREIGAPFGSTNGIVGRPRELSLSANFRF